MPWSQKPPIGTRIDLSHSLSKGLVSAWLMNENGGGTVYDSVNYPHGNNGTLTGMAFPPTPTSGWNPGKGGSALAFDRVNDNISYNAVCSGATSMAIIIEVCPTIANNVNSVIGGWDGLNDDVDKSFISMDTSGGMSLSSTNTIGGSRNTVTYSTTWVLHNWYQIAYVYNGTSENLYINGSLKTSVARTGTVTGGSSGTPAIGRAGTTYLGGKISCVYIYSNKKNIDIAQLYSDPYCIYQQPKRVVYFIMPAIERFIPAQNIRTAQQVPSDILVW